MLEHGDALEYDLLTLGLDLRKLGTPELTYRRLALVVRHLPRTSATAAQELGERAEWSASEHLLALIADTLALANWQRAHGKGQRPKPLKRPGQQADEGPKKRIGGGGRLSMEAARSMFFKEGEGDG